jgi:hypothetical protein
MRELSLLGTIIMQKCQEHEGQLMVLNLELENLNICTGLLYFYCNRENNMKNVSC